MRKFKFLIACKVTLLIFSITNAATLFQTQINVKQLQLGTSCTLKINSISPKQIFTSSNITISYNLRCDCTLAVDKVPVKVALFINNELKQISEIENFPNHKTLRLFISAKAPKNPGLYTILLKAVRFDANPGSATGRAVYATTRKNIEVNSDMDLVILDSQVVIRPEKPLLGEDFNVVVPVKNDGKISVSNVELRFMIFKNGRALQEKIRTAVRIDPGRTFTFRADFGTGREESEYEMRITADPKNKIIETNETNNYTSKLFTIVQPEKIIESSPIEGETGVGLIPLIKIKFSKDIKGLTCVTYPKFKFRRSGFVGTTFKFYAKEALRPLTRYILTLNVAEGLSHRLHFTTMQREEWEADVRFSRRSFTRLSCGPKPDSYTLAKSLLGDYEGYFDTRSRIRIKQAYCSYVKFFGTITQNDWKKIYEGDIVSATLHVDFLSRYTEGDPLNDLGPILVDQAEIRSKYYKRQQAIYTGRSMFSCDITEYLRKRKASIYSSSRSALEFYFRFTKGIDHDNENDFILFGDGRETHIKVKLQKHGKYSQIKK